MCNARIRQCSDGSPRLTNSDFGNTEIGSEHPCDGERDQDGRSRSLSRIIDLQARTQANRQNEHTFRTDISTSRPV